MSWVKRLICHCDICGHEWIPNISKPIFCAKCKSRLWNGSTVPPNKKRGKP
jgi:predicted Zn-ribbon and HTH transcriptional regulator